MFLNVDRAVGHSVTALVGKVTCRRICLARKLNCIQLGFSTTCRGGGVSAKVETCPWDSLQSGPDSHVGTASDTFDGSARSETAVRQCCGI